MMCDIIRCAELRHQKVYVTVTRPQQSTCMDPDDSARIEPPPAKEWRLQPQSEYRFELDPDVTLAIEASSFSHSFV